MQLEDYFDFLAPDDIRIKGHRIGIEHLLHEYLIRQMTVEELAERFDTLSLEEIHATILYYLHNKEAVTKYLEDWLEFCRLSREESRRKHAPLYEKLRRLKEEQDARNKQESA